MTKFADIIQHIGVARLLIGLLIMLACAGVGGVTVYRLGWTPATITQWESVVILGLIGGAGYAIKRLGGKA